MSAPAREVPDRGRQPVPKVPAALPGTRWARRREHPPRSWRPARGGVVSFDFLARNAGDWLFHCHNHHHVEDGMVRLVRYVPG